MWHVLGRSKKKRARKRHIKPFLNVVHYSDVAEHLKLIKEYGICGTMVDMALLSARAFFSILHVARTIADLDARDVVLRDDIAESFQYHQPLPFEQNTERKMSS